MFEFFHDSTRIASVCKKEVVVRPITGGGGGRGQTIHQKVGAVPLPEFFLSVGVVTDFADDRAPLPGACPV